MASHLGAHSFVKRDRNASFEAVQNLAALTNSAITYLYYGAPVEVASAIFEDAYMVIAPLSGVSRLTSENREFELSTGHGFILHPDSAFTLETPVPASALMWKLDRATLERHAAELIGRQVRRSLKFHPQIDWLTGKPRSLLRCMRFVADELNDLDGAAASRHVRENMEQLLLRVLLEAQPNDIQDHPEFHGVSIAPSCVRRVEAYIEAHGGEPLTSRDLARASGVSARTMYAAFKRFRDTTPMAYLRDVRMKNVRDDLLRADGAASVTEIMTRRGIVQFGRFAVHYKQRYGESPSRTRTLRGYRSEP